MTFLVVIAVLAMVQYALLTVISFEMEKERELNLMIIASLLSAIIATLSWIKVIE